MRLIGVELVSMRQQALIGIVLVAATQVQAAPVALNEDELKAAMIGRTVKIDTPLGTPLTVQIGANGIMQGTATAALALYLGSAKDRGRWRIKDGKLCQKWFKWLDAEESCISIKQDGLKIYWRREDGKTGTAMLEPGPPELAGVTPSGLGLPQLPTTQTAPETVVAQTPEVAMPTPAALETQPRVAAMVRPQPIVPRAMPAVLEQLQPAVEPRAVALETTAEPQLLEPPRVVARRPPGSVRLAAFAPMRPIAPSGATGAAPAPPAAAAMADPFDAQAQPMRWAADLSAIAAIEYRWCHADAFSRGPVAPRAADLSLVSARIELEAVPNLLAVFYETSYPDELPLHDAACLTAAPALLHVPKVSVSAR